ncbi:protein D2-like isoform X1 [Maniola hyperantus]|uniref:protein D2-like isoform X1 n=1 Tax=Aphantopus hyperantus TaxID=2795564 RepID=UPI001568FECA|nr:uncharacterized protein LOC117991956 [Maniola hyperantus]
MKLILACTAVVLLLSAVELAKPMYRRRNSISQIYRAANITPVPKQLLEVNIGELEITPGIEICPEDAIEMPTIAFDFDPGCYYTFLVINLDYSSIPEINPGLLQLSVNLNGDSADGLMMDESNELASWAGPAPAPGRGPNRYVFSVYKQPEIIDTANETLLSYEVNRLGFPFEEFLETYDLSSLVAGTFFIAQYPENCCEV